MTRPVPSRHTACLLLAAVLVPLALPGCQSGPTPRRHTAATPPADRPNVLLILTDDQGYGDLSCHGNPILRTPHMDRLYRQSVRLTDFHVDPCCSPTRAALLTGQYSDRAGVWHTIMGRSILLPGKDTLADLFRKAGYRTGLFGKWHLGDSYPFRPQDRGFDHVLTFGGGAIGNAQDYWNNDYFDDTYFHNGQPEKFTGYCNDIWFDQAIAFLRANRHRPFFCYLATNLPHHPYRAPEKYIDQYRGKVDDEHLAAYYGMLANVDDNLGRLLAELDRLGLADNTFLIFMSDNGADPWTGPIRVDENQFVIKGYNAGMRGGKISEYEGGHRVHCLVRWPAGGIAGGRDVDRLTCHFDWMPTLIEACGLPRPRQQLDGRSMLGLLRGKADAWPDDRTVVVNNQRVDFPVKGKNYQVMTNRWRMVNGRELYDIKADPGQRHDLAGRYPDVVARLQKQYERWWASLAESHQRFAATVVGSGAAPQVMLSPHDWHGDRCWDQGHVRDGSKRNGVWVIEAARDGLYRIELRRWPREADLPLTAPAGDRGKALPITRARLKVGTVEKAMPVDATMKAAVFTVAMKKGLTCLQTWFDDRDGQSRGAYYVYVRRLGDAPADQLAAYRPTRPQDVIAH